MITFSQFISGFFWYLLHLLISVVYLWSHIIQLLQSSNSPGVETQYKELEVEKINYIAIVVESEEAKNTRAIVKLLLWLSSINVKYVILYDMDGILKKSIGVGMKNNVFNKNTTSSSRCFSYIENMTIEILSSCDNKEGLAKAASFLCSKYLKDDGSVSSNTGEPAFTVSDVSVALEAVGICGPEPELLLIYGPARCHLGFPAWRLTYTEMVHMGPLKSMKSETIVKAISDFLKKSQNYGK